MAQTWVLYVLLTTVPTSYQFLLTFNNSNSGSNSAGNKQYVTVSEFFDQLHMMQRATDRTFALLSTQVDQKFASLEKAVSDKHSENCTLTPGNDLEVKYRYLEDNNTKLQQRFNDLQAKYNALETSLHLSQNKTSNLSEKIKSLEQLTGIQQLQEFRLLQQEVKTISAQSHSLAVQQQARSQDFLALYNQSLAYKSILDNLVVHVETKFNEQEHIQNKTIGAIYDQIEQHENYQKVKDEDIERKLQQIESIYNVSTADIYRRIALSNKQNAHNSEKVALTACVDTDITYNEGQTVKFVNVKTHVGITDISSFTSTGKFTCHSPGLYYVSVSIVSSGTAGGINIYKNGSLVTLYTRVDNLVKFNGVTTSAALELQTNDKVWIHISGNVEIDSWGSCLTIFKVN